MATAVIINDSVHAVRLIDSYNYPLIAIKEQYGSIKINEVLPFRIRFTNIGIEGYSSTNPPAIGIAVIGINNWIL
jgi:hypothetical protein